MLHKRLQNGPEKMTSLAGLLILLSRPSPITYLIESNNIMMLPTTTLLLCMIILLQNTDAWSPGLHVNSQNHCISSSSSCITRLMMMADDDDEDIKSNAKHSGYNVLGTELCCCCSNVGGSGIGTGFYRNGYCGKYTMQ